MVRQGRLARLVDGDAFNLVIAVVILVNAVALGLETYPQLMATIEPALVLVNEICFGIFVLELVLRIASYGRRPWDFFRNGWNVFDFIIIGAALIPGLRANAQILRLLRLLRVVRLLRFLPDARVLISTVLKAIPAVVSLLVLTLLVLFIYGMVGTYIFGPDLPGSWGSIGRSMLTLFVLLTLENFPTYLDEAIPVSAFAVPFFISYVLVAAFVVFNLLIGIIIGAAESARESERIRVAAREREQGGVEEAALARIEELRSILEALETDIRISRLNRPNPVTQMES